jgi:hypothetical protein
VVTPELIEAAIARCEFHLFDKTTRTTCVLTLVNGFTVDGTAAALPTTQFDPQIGMGIARKQAMGKVGDYLAFAAMDQMAGSPMGSMVDRALDALKEKTQ